jgi:hypothetical protein
MKLLNEAHRKNSERAMKALSERKLPLDLKKVQEEILRNSKDPKKTTLKNA